MDARKASVDRRRITEWVKQLGKRHSRPFLTLEGADRNGTLAWALAAFPGVDGDWKAAGVGNYFIQFARSLTGRPWGILHQVWDREVLAFDGEVAQSFSKADILALDAILSARVRKDLRPHVLEWLENPQESDQMYSRADMVWLILTIAGTCGIIPPSFLAFNDLEKANGSDTFCLWSLITQAEKWSTLGCKVGLVFGIEAPDESHILFQTIKHGLET